MFKLLTHWDDFNKKSSIYFFKLSFLHFLLRPLVGISVVVHISQFEKLYHMLFCETPYHLLLLQEIVSAFLHVYRTQGVFSITLHFRIRACVGRSE